MKGELASYLAILETEPDNERALAALEELAPKVKEGNGVSIEAAARALGNARRVHRERNDWDLVARLLDLELAWTTDIGRRADLLYEKGRVLSDELLRDDEAVACFQKVLEVRPDDGAAQEVLGHLTIMKDNWEPIAGRYLADAKAASEKQLATSLYLSAAELYIKNSPEAEQGDAFLRKALELDPRNRKAVAHLERRLRAQGKTEELTALLTRRSESAPSKEERATALVSLAEVIEKQGDTKQTLAAWQKVLTLDPANSRALRALVDALTEEGDWAGLVKIYEAALKARPRGEQEAALILQIGMLYWKKLQDLESAEPYFRRVRKAEPSHPMALEFYRAFFTARGEGGKLLVVLQAAAKVETDPARRLQLAIEMARGAETEASATEKAIDLWKAVLRMQAGEAGEAQQYQTEAAEALRRLYRKTEKWNALLELLKDEIESLPKDKIPEKIVLHLEVADIYREKLGLDAMVISSYQNILALDPGHEKALEQLAARYEALGRWNDLIGVLARRADAVTEKSARVTLLRRVALLWLEKFANANQAVRPLEEILTLEPDDAQTIASLRDIYARRRSWKQLLDLDRRELGRLHGAEKRARMAQMARLAAERLGDARESINLWNLVLAEDERDAEALTSLVSLYEREKRWPALVEMLRRQVAVATEQAQKVVLLERVGLLFVERLSAPQRATEFYRQILALQPGHQKAQRTLRELYAQQGDFSELERLYAESGQWEELAETLLAFVDRAQDTAARLQLLSRIASIYIEKLGKPDRAVKSYERILALDPGNVDAARALVPIYRQGEKWARLLETYKILLGHTREAPEKLELLREIRQLCEQRLGSKGLAFEWATKAYELAPADPQVGAELERLAEEAGAWEDLSALYARRAEGLSDATQQIVVFRRLAKIAKEKTGRSADARKYWEEVLARDGHDAEALGALEQIFTQTSAWPELAGIYRRRAEAETDIQKRLELELRVAFLEEERLGDLKASAQSYRKALATARDTASHKEQARTLSALERIHTALQQWPEVISILEDKLAAADSDESKASIYVQQGAIFEMQLSDSARALAAYRQAVGLGGARGAMTALERFLDHRELGVEAARLLAPIHERENEHEKQARDLEILLAAEKDAHEQLAIPRRLALIYGRKLANPVKAYDHGGRVLEKHYDDPEVRRIMSQLAEALEKWDDYATRLELCAMDTQVDAVRYELYGEIAEIYDTHVHEPRKAAEFYAKVSGATEQTERSFIALARIYRQEEKWPELRKLLEDRQKMLLDPERRLELLFQICDLNEGVLDDQDDAVRVYRQVLEVDPANTRSYKALERILAAQEKWGELDALLQQELGQAANHEDAAAMRFKRAELRATHLSDLSGAVDLLEEVLAQVPSHEKARKVLERLMGLPELRQRVALILEPYYEKDEAWAKLAAVLEVRREPLEGAAALDMLARIASLQEEKLTARQASFLTWRESLRLAPGDERARDNVSRLGTMLEKWNDLAQAWEEGFALSPKSDLTLRADYLERAAKLYEGSLADPARAQGAWRRLLDLDPHNAPTAQPAAAALAELYERAGAWTDLVEILRTQAEWADDSAARKALLLRIARIQENNLGSSEQAIATYRAVLEQEPEDQAALDALERLYSGGSSWRDQIGILKRRVDLSRNAKERRDLYWRIAEIQERELGAAAEAIESYTAILDELPDDVAALRAIGRLYEQAGRFQDLREILIRELALTEARDGKLELMHRLGQLAEEKLARLDAALERWREILTLDATDARAISGIERALGDETLKLQAAEVLEPIWQSRGDLAKQIALHELLADAQSDPEARVGRLRAAAELKERTGDPDGAFDTYARAARDAAGGAELGGLLDALDRLAAERRRPDDLAALYREIGGDVLDSQLQQRMYLVIADLARPRDPATAREYYRRVIDAAPDHPKALRALEALYLEGQEWEPLFETYQRRADLTEDLDEKRDYLARAATLCEEKLARPGEAISFHEQILEIVAGDRDAMNALERLYGDAQRWADLADFLERRLGFADDLEEAVRLRFRLGELYEKLLKDPDRAVENYRATLGGEPGHEGAIAALERYLEDPAQQGPAAEVLEPVYASRQDWPKLVRIYEIRLMAAEEPKLRLSLLRRIARLYEEQLEDLDHAFQWYGKVFRDAPEDRGARDQLVRLAGVLEKWKELAEIYQAYLDDTMEPGPAWTAVCWTLAGLYDERLGDVDRAKECYLRLLEQSQGDRGVLEALERSLVRSKRWRDLLDFYEDTVSKEPDAQARKDVLGKIARVQEKELGDADEAVAAWRRVLEQDPEDRNAMDSLDRLLVAGEKWHDLVELLVSQLERASDSEWISIKYRLGTIFEKNLEDPNAAIDAYEECITRDATQKEALASLERLVMDHDYRFRIAQILEPLYKNANEWAKLVVIYDAQLEFIEDASKRVDILREMARLHENNGKIKHAWEALARAFKEDPQREDSLVELERVTATMNRFGDLVGVLENAAEGVYDPEISRGLYARAAEHYADRLGDASAAITAWRKVLEAKDDDQKALASLEKLLEISQRWQELIEILERRSDLAEDGTERKSLLYRAAELEEHQLVKPERAAELWHRVLGLDDADEAALDSLERLHGAASEWRELSDILVRKIELALEPQKKRALLFKQADVWENKIEDRYEAIGCYKAAREMDPNDAKALAALDRLYESEKMWADLLEILEARIQLEANPSAREDLRFRSAVVTEQESGELDSAIERYRKVLDALPDYQGARDRLFALVRAEGTREPAAAALEPFLRARKEWPRLVEILELRIEAESDAALRRQLLAELAQVHEQGKGDLQAAFAAWGRVLGEDAGDNDAQRELERLAAARGGFADLAALYEDRLANQYDAEIGRQLALKLATIYEDALGDAASAVDKLRQALDYPGDERGPLAALDRLLETLGRWPELAEILEREAQAGLEPAEQAGYLYRLGLLRLERLTDHDGAIEAWRDVLERDPNHEGSTLGIARYLDDATYREQAIEILEPAYESRQDHQNLVRVLEVKLQVTEEPLERARLLERIAELQENELGGKAAALDAWARALMEDPSELRYADEVARLGDGLGMPGEAAARIEAVADAAVEKSKEAARDLGLRAGAIWLGKARDLARGEARYRRVLDLDAENQEALEALDQIARGKGDDAVLSETLQRRAALELDTVKKRELYAEAAAIAEQKLRDPKAAIEAWKAVVESDDTDAAALGELARLYDSSGEWVEHAQALERQARVTDDPSGQATLYARAGSVWLGRLSDADHAADAYRAALDAKAGDPEVLRALEEVHTRRNDWLAVQEVLTQQLQSAKGSADQVAIYAKLARLAEEKNESVDEAIGFWTQALDADPSNEKVFAELERLLQACEKWYELADVLNKHAELCAQRGEAGGELAKLLMLADVWERRIGNSDSAAEILEKVLERDPKNVSAMTQLARMYESAGDWDKCAATLERAAALGPTDGPAAELYFRMGKVEMERAGGDDAKAEPHWTRALQFDAGHAEALEGLEGLARGRADWRRVVQLLDLREKSERDPAKKRDLLAEIGKLLRTELHAPEEALAYLERAMALAPEDASVAEPLADGYFAAGRMAEAGKLYAGLLDKLKGKKSKDVARLTFRLGAIAEQAGQAPQATEYFNQAFTIDPTHGPTMAALGRLYQSQNDWEKARKVYRSMLLQNLDAETGMTKADVYLELGRIHARLGEGPKARNMFERGLEAQPDHRGLKEALAELR